MIATCDGFTPHEARMLLQTARSSVRSALEGRRAEVPEAVGGQARFREPRGCFVTLRNRRHELRGCIGTFHNDRPLIDNLVEMAAAATRDPRFVRTRPVIAAELPELVIEVSVLTPLQPIGDPQAMRLGVDGIVIEAPGGKRGCFLPQVAGEQGWDVAQTLEACCSHKLGLPADAWRQPGNLKFYVFQAQVIEEKV